MATIDLDSPLIDFFGRIEQVKLIVQSVAALSKDQRLRNASSGVVDVFRVGTQTENTVNAMSIVFLASSFEEFVREEVGQCADYLSERYIHLKDEDRHKVRGKYWATCLDRMRLNSSILMRKAPAIPDPFVISRVKALLESAQGFVVDNDPVKIDRANFYYHANNFRPHVVDEIALRLGIKDLMAMSADSSKLRSYFGVTKKPDVYLRLRSKLDEFYERRNSIVHSLAGNSGFAFEIIMDYADFFSIISESMKTVLERATGKW